MKFRFGDDMAFIDQGLNRIDFRSTPLIMRIQVTDILDGRIPVF